MAKETVGEAIARLRKEKGMTLGKLSELSGISAVEISMLEKGERKPWSSTIAKLAKALECDVSELY